MAGAWKILWNFEEATERAGLFDDLSLEKLEKQAWQWVLTEFMC